MLGPLRRALEGLARWQVERPLRVIAVVLLTLFPAGWLASHLGLRTSFSELLPDSKPSVVEMRRVNERLSSLSTLSIVVEGSGPKILKAYVDAITPRLVALGPTFVSGVDSGPREVQQFFEANKHLYAKVEDLRDLRNDVAARYDATVSKEAGFDLGLDDDEPAAPVASGVATAQGAAAPAASSTKAPPQSELDAVLKRFEIQADAARKTQAGQDGYYIGEGGTLAAILVRTPLGSGDPKAFELRKKIEQLTAELGFAKQDPKFRVMFTGNLITSAEQQRAIISDLTHVGGLGVLLVLGVVFLFFLRLRTLLAMGLTIIVGLVWSFGVAQLTVGYLNTATGFLVSIIAGNGINFSIIFMARYIEARRDEGLPVTEAIHTTRRETWGATLAAAGAAMVAYGSLAATDFRGFKHFGIIGGAGMLLCWTSTYALLPALLVASERIRPMFSGKQDWRAKVRGFYGMPFAWATVRIPRSVAVLGLLSGIAGIGLSAWYFTHGPMERDLAKIRDDRTAPTSAGMLSGRVDQIVGRLGQDGRAIVLERVDQVQPLTRALEARLARAPKGHEPFDKVVSIFDLLPKEQPEKLKLLEELKDRVARAREHKALSDADWKRVSPHVPDELKTISIESLPEPIARPFTEKNGTRGTIVYIVPRTGRSVYDADYLLEFADSFRETKLPNGEIIRGTGDSVIFADMLINVEEDAPKAILLSLLGTLAIVLLAFRGRAAGWMTLGALLLGMAWLVGVLQWTDTRLNFLNFVCLPISIGVGADYALNVMKRHGLLGVAGLQRMLVETGGAVVLCSLTTMLGYLALLGSINGAVRSFGFAAAVGEATTLLAAVLVLPCLLAWKQLRRTAAPVAATATPPEG